MIEARSSFGFLFIKNLNSIIVAGGKTDQNELTGNCEIYNINDDRWSQWKPLSEAKSNVSICYEFDKSEEDKKEEENEEEKINLENSFYCFGGLIKND